MSNVISSNTGRIAQEPETTHSPNPIEDENRRLGVALVGLGAYSEKQLAPALQETMHCRLAAVVSGSREKLEKWGKKYNLDPSCLYTYENFDDIASNEQIDVVYIVLPNSMHAEYVIRAARAGKHVICEKPMATSVEECQQMIDACRQAGVQLSIGYRLHFEPYTQEMMRLGQQQLMGPVHKVIARDGMDVGEKDQWRVKKALAGGGPLMDVGIYCVQGVLYTLGELPVAVTARYADVTDAERFQDVEEGLVWTMYFESGAIAECETSYSKELNLLRAETGTGWFMLEPAYEYGGLKGKTSEGAMNFAEINQQAAQMDDFAVCIKTNTPTRVPGEMGLRDVQILRAIYEAAETGKKVGLQFRHMESLVEM